MGRPGGSLDLLRRTLELGQATDGPAVTLSLLAHFIAIDPDLVSLHGDPEFEAIVAAFERAIPRVLNL